jgi:hypothetical protein
VIREHCGTACELLAPGAPLPWQIPVKLPAGSYRSPLCAFVASVLAGCWRHRGLLGLEASHAELVALAWAYGVPCSLTTMRRALDDLEASGAVQIMRRVWTAPAGWRDASGRPRSRLQVRSVYSLSIPLLTACGKPGGRTVPLCAVLLGCPRRAAKGCSGESEAKISEQSAVDIAEIVPAPRRPAHAEGFEGRSAAKRPLGVVCAFVLLVLTLAFAAMGCDRAPLAERPDALADASDGGTDDGGPPACRCALRAGPDAGCAPGCPGGLCCE